MVTVDFASSIRRHVAVARTEVEAATVREALEAVFAQHERLRSYLVDDRGALRKHVAVVVDGTAIGDREHLGDAVPDGGEIFVMQALSGG